MRREGRLAPEAARAAIAAAAASVPFLPTLGARPGVALHAAATLLVLALGRRLGLGPLAATAAASLFGLHPVHVAALAAPGGLGVQLWTVTVLAAALAAEHLPPGRARLAGRAGAAVAAACALGAQGAWPGAGEVWLLAFPRALSAAATLGDPARLAAEQALYLPGAAFCLGAVWLVRLAASQAEPDGRRVGVGRLVPAAGLVLLVVLAARAAVHAAEWRDAAAAPTTAARR